jgi:beta-lactamase superfamily II metal-dependent hydrolase
MDKTPKVPHFLLIRGRAATRLLILWVLLIVQGCDASPDFVWSMVNVNESHLQGDAHLIEVKGGKTVLIDAGYLEPARRQLVPLLVRKGIHRLDLVIITHPHRDHYEGLLPLLEAGIALEKVYFNIPDKALCDREHPWGCDYQQILDYHQRLTESGAAIETIEPGISFAFGSGVSAEVLYVYDGINTPVGRTDINDMSAIMLVRNRGVRILFAGDLNRAIGGYLAEHGENLSADLLKVPHHGTEGIAPNSFFAKVDPEVALVPGPAWLWCDDRSARPRQWFSDNEIPVWVNGFHGHVTVSVYKDRYRITPEIGTTVECAQ